MDKFMKALRQALKKHFYQAEVDEICAYYEEMIYERKAQGERMDDTLSDYQVKDILRDMLPEVVEKRTTTSRNIVKSNSLLLGLLISTPLLLPLGIAYIVMISVFFAMIVTGASLMISGVAVIFGFIVQAFLLWGSTSSVLLILGIGFITAAVLMLTGHIMIFVFKKLMMILILATSRLAKKIGGKKHESI